MKLSESPAYFEAIANHPRVWPSITLPGFDRCDLSPIWADCVGLEFDGGGFFFRRLGAVWNVHVLFLPGNWQARRCAREAIAWIGDHGCREVRCVIRHDVRRAQRLAKDIGMRFTGNTHIAGVEHACYAMEIS